MSEGEKFAFNSMNAHPPQIKSFATRETKTLSQLAQSATMDDVTSGTESLQTLVLGRVPQKHCLSGRKRFPLWSHKQERMAWKEMRLVPDDTERRTTVMGLMSARNQAQLLSGVVRAVQRLGQPESQPSFIQNWVGDLKLKPIPSSLGCGMFLHYSLCF